MNHIRFFLRPVAAATLALACQAGQAADFTFDGSMAFHNSVLQIGFTLGSDTAHVRLWSDSWQSGLNFDPTAAVWRLQGGAYTLVSAVDDDDTVAPGQGFYDTGFAFPTLAAGEYRLTLTTAVNAPNGTALSQGFAYDLETPVPIALWDQPTRDINANDQKGAYWRVHLAAVDQATPVPEPATWALMALGALLIGVRLTGRQRGA